LGPGPLFLFKPHSIGRAHGGLATLLKNPGPSSCSQIKKILKQKMISVLRMTKKK